MHQFGSQGEMFDDVPYYAQTRLDLTPKATHTCEVSWILDIQYSYSFLLCIDIIVDI